MLTLDTKKREANGNMKSLRENGFVPAVFYGPGTETTSITVPLKEFRKVLEEAGESTVVTLKTEDGDKDALIHDVDVHPVSEVPLHADFYIFDKTKTVEVAVPLEFVGIAPAVKDLGGILVKVLHEVNIEALPMNLPHEITVDISSLTTFDSIIHASDLKLPSGVTLVDDAEEVVASVSEAKEEVEEETPPADLSSIEVEKKGKDEEAAPEGESKDED